MSDAAAKALLAKAAAFAASEASANGKSCLYLFHVNYEEALNVAQSFLRGIKSSLFYSADIQIAFNSLMIFLVYWTSF